MEKKRKIIIRTLFVVYIAVLFRITVFRSGFSPEQFMQNGTINATLFQEYIPLLQKGRWFLFLYLFVGNIIWFMPFGWGLLAFLKVRHVWMATLCGLMLSLVIETLQYLFGTGVSELDDLVLNTTGAWAGAAAWQVYRYFRGRRT